MSIALTLRLKSSSSRTPRIALIHTFRYIHTCTYTSHTYLYMTYMTCDPTVEEGTSTVAYYYIKLRKETEIRNNEKKKNQKKLEPHHVKYVVYIHNTI